MAGESGQVTGGWRGPEPGAAAGGREGEPGAPPGIPAAPAGQAPTREFRAPAAPAEQTPVREPSASAAPDGQTPVPEPAAAPGALPAPDGQVRPTGEPRVDAAVARLDELAGLPVTEHTRVFDDVHRRLEDVLGELGTGAAEPGR